MGRREDLRRKGIREYEAVEIRPESGTLLGKVLRVPGALLDEQTLERLRSSAEDLPQDVRDLLAAYEALRETRVEIGSPQCKRLLYRYQPALKQRGLLVLHYVDPTTAEIAETRVILEPETGSRDLSRSGIRLDNGILRQAVTDFNRSKER